MLTAGMSGCSRWWSARDSTRRDRRTASALSGAVIAASRSRRLRSKYLKPAERSGHDISLSVDINAAVAIENIQCSSHAANIQASGGSIARVVLAPQDSIPQQGFRAEIPGGRAHAQVGRAGTSHAQGWILHADARAAGRPVGASPLQPLEMVFTVDVSGSMNGRPGRAGEERCVLRAAGSGRSRYVPGSSDSPTAPTNSSTCLGRPRTTTCALREAGSTPTMAAGGR